MPKMTRKHILIDDKTWELACKLGEFDQVSAYKNSASAGLRLGIAALDILRTENRIADVIALAKNLREN